MIFSVQLALGIGFMVHSIWLQPVSITELVAVPAAFNASTHRFGMVRPALLAKAEVIKLLRRYGIRTFSWHHDSKNFYFSVKKRQARWAEYILLNAGVELDNPTFDRRNPGYVGRHGPGWMPTPWSEKEREPASASPTVETPTTKPTSSLGRLSRWMDDLLED